jgi:cytochrome c biogenesis protein CcdA
MIVIGMLLLLIGILCCLGGWIVILKAAFAESFLTGLGCVFVPCFVLLFSLQRFHDTKKGLAAYVAGVILLVIGAALVDAARL